MTTSLPRFTADLLAQLGATVTAHGKDRILVALPPEWAHRFDHRELLTFAFTPEAVLEPGAVELLIPGSYWLERLLDIARERGSLGDLRLPQRISAREAEATLPPEILFLEAREWWNICFILSQKGNSHCLSSVFFS